MEECQYLDEELDGLVAEIQEKYDDLKKTDKKLTAAARTDKVEHPPSPHEHTQKQPRTLCCTFLPRWGSHPFRIALPTRLRGRGGRANHALANVPCTPTHRFVSPSCVNRIHPSTLTPGKIQKFCTKKNMKTPIPPAKLYDAYPGDGQPPKPQTVHFNLQTANPEP